MTVIVETDLPASILRRLEVHGVGHCQVRREHPDIPPAQRVQITWMEDPAGTLLVLYTQSYLLDLSHLNSLTGRALEVLSCEQHRQHFARYELGVLSCLLMKGQIPCMCEARLLEQPKLWVDFGQPGWLLELLPETFEALVVDMRLERFGIAVSGIQAQFDAQMQSSDSVASTLRSFASQRICQRLDEAVEIPPLSQTAGRLAALRNNPNAGLDDLAYLVETDPPLAAQVISWASSSYHTYSAPEKIRSVRDAIARALGFERVINLALGLAVGKALKLPNSHAMSISYWHQAIYTAMVVDGLVHVMPPALRPEAGIAYLVGLLHNFGHLILAHVFPPYFVTLCQHQDANPHLPSNLIEYYLLGISREQIGAWLMRRWNMPDELVTAMYYQKDPHYRGEYAVYANLIWLAVHLLAQRDIGPLRHTEIPAALLARLGLNPEQAEGAVSMVLDAEAELRELARQMQHASRS